MIYYLKNNFPNFQNLLLQSIHRYLMRDRFLVNSMTFSQCRVPNKPYTLCLLTFRLYSSFIVCLLKHDSIYRKIVSSRPVYYSILETFGQRSQYKRIEFPLYKHSSRLRYLIKFLTTDKRTDPETS